MRSPVSDLHLSNVLTYASLMCALGAMAAAPRGGASLAGALLAASALADTFDGRLARCFVRSERQRRLGRELDSLADIVSFGVAPVALLASLAMPVGQLPYAIWWTAGFAYVLAAATRLSFYNVEEHADRFIGLPAPVAALVWATCLLGPVPSWLVALLFVGLGTAMVAPLLIPRPRGRALAVFAAWPVVLVALHLARL